MSDNACDGEVCITCGDVALPFPVTRLLDDGLALVRTEAGEEEVSVALVDAAVGDVVLVHAGEALAVLPPDPATEASEESGGPT